MPVVADWAATAMFVVFAVAFLAKARSPHAFDDFAASLSQFGISSIGGQRLVAGLTLLLEAAAAAGLLLLTGHPLARFTLPVLLLAGFALAVAASARGGRQSACHCFGTSTELPPGPHVVLNAGLAALGLLAVLGGDSAGSTGDTVLGVGLGVISGVLFVGSADLYIALSTGRRAAGSRETAQKAG